MLTPSWYRLHLEHLCSLVLWLMTAILCSTVERMTSLLPLHCFGHCRSRMPTFAWCVAVVVVFPPTLSWAVSTLTFHNKFKIWFFENSNCFTPLLWNWLFFIAHRIKFKPFNVSKRGLPFFGSAYHLGGVNSLCQVYQTESHRPTCGWG